jgi:hypothetical protein
VGPPTHGYPGSWRPLAHEIAKLLLEKAGSFLERKEAIEAAMGMGMPLNEIEEYLDWLDSIRPGGPERGDTDEDNSDNSSQQGG